MRFESRGQEIQAHITRQTYNHLLGMQGLVQIEMLLCQHRLPGAQRDLNRVGSTGDRHGEGEALARPRWQFDRTGKRRDMEVATRLAAQPGAHLQCARQRLTDVVHLHRDHVQLAQTHSAL